MKHKKTKIYMRETTEGLKVISKTTNNYTMVMVLSPKQWEALKNSKKPIIVLKGGDLRDPDLEVQELDSDEKAVLEDIRKRAGFVGD